MLKGFLSFSLLIFFISAQAQTHTDTTQVLSEVTIHAYEYDRPLKEVAASIGIISKKDLERFNTTSLVPAINTIPGVRMEERSPGSYRLSIRGSTLRSPFGVRNVKVYWNDLPFTDPGGNTYLNLLDFNSVQSAEVIKGPGSSLYGAGTGGVLLLKSAPPNFNQNELQVSASAGSFGLWRYSVGLQTGSEKLNTNFQYTHQQADGYRAQSKMKRDVLQGQTNYRITNKSVLSVNILYADLTYQTPGALTKDQYNKDPSQARPTEKSAGAIDQHAAIYNKTIYGSISNQYDISKHWLNRTGAYGSYTDFQNPTIRNDYEVRYEKSFGARSVTQFSDEKFKLNFGVEYQHGLSPVNHYDNILGTRGKMQSDDEISTTTALVFLQTDFTLPYNFFLTLAGSYNFSNVGFSHFTNTDSLITKRKFKPVFSPRIALLKKITSSISIYGSISEGFSPPTVADLYPSTGEFSKTLQAEKGQNYEAGVRGTLFKNSLTFDFTAYSFQQKNTIVSRRDTTLAGDPEYFVNAGNTSQKGLEASVAWMKSFHQNNLISSLKLWTAYSLNHYQFKNYYKDTVRLSGNKLTGVAPNVFLLGGDVTLNGGLYANVTYSFTDKIPLDDNNTAFANSYNLLSARVGYRTTIKKLFIEFFGGGDNLLDERYSLGNDLNAAAARYYNAAPTRNFYVGLKSNLSLNKK